MKTIALLAFLLSACVDFDDGSTQPPNPSDGDIVETAGIDGSHDTTPIVPPCTADCYDVVAFNSYFFTHRPDGSAWDSDGSAPEVTLELRVSGVSLGSTTVQTMFLTYPPPIDSYRATFNEALGTTPVRVGDMIDAILTDADEGYIVNECHFKVAPVMLQYGNVGCGGTTGQIEIHFLAVTP